MRKLLFLLLFSTFHSVGYSLPFREGLGVGSFTCSAAAQPRTGCYWEWMNGNAWVPAEVNTSIRPGWFYKVSEGEFSNIENNPIRQTVTTPVTTARYIRLVATRLCQGTQPKIADFKLMPVQEPFVQTAHEFSADAVTLKPSWVTEREQLDTAFINSIDADRMLHNFRMTAGLPSEAQPLGGWESPKIGLRGHFTGHYLSALSTLVARYHRPSHIEKLQYMVAELARCQQAHGNGYLSAFPEKDFDVLETKFKGVWAPYYTLHKIMQGLLDAYVLADNCQALDVVVAMAAYVEQRMSRLAPETIEQMLYTVEANPANEAGAMNEVLYKLYAVTKAPRHLELAKQFDPDWLATPLSKGEDILSGLHANTHLVLVNGFAQRHMLTGEAKYSDAAYRFWDILTAGHCYANGSSSGPRPNATTRTAMTAEHWGEAGHLSNTLSGEIAESCVSHNTQKLSNYLFSWTADAKYADQFMNMYYNAVLPVQSATTGQVVYHLPLGSPRTKKYLKPDDFYCCSGTSTEAFVRLNTGIYWHDRQTLWVNNYVPSVLDWKEKGVVLSQEGSFPCDSVVSLKVERSPRKGAPFALKLLIPSWADSASVVVNGERQTIVCRPGTASYHTIDRTWKKGDAVRLTLHGGFRLHSLAGNNRTVAITYGGMLLAFEGNSELFLHTTEAELLKGLRVDNLNEGRFSLHLADRHYTLIPLFAVDKESYSVYISL